MTKLNKKVGKFIPREEAEKQIRNWEKTGIETRSSFFGSEIINEILGGENVIGLRIHYAMDDNGNMQPMLTPVKDPSFEQEGNDKPVYGDASYPCPPYC